MSDTAAPAAPAAPVVHSVTLPTGVTITSSMSPLEKHNAIAKSIGSPEVPRPPGIPFGPALAPSTGNELARGDARAAAQAARDQLANDYAARTAELAASPNTAVNAPYVEALNALYRSTPAEIRDTTLFQQRWQAEHAYASAGGGCTNYPAAVKT